MSKARPALPAYIRLPDGLRLAGSVTMGKDELLSFQPKQAISQLPPVGLPVHLMVAGLPGDDEAQLSVSGSIESINAREVLIEADSALPDALVEVLVPEAVAWVPPPGESAQLLKVMRDTGTNQLLKAMRRFIVDLCDELFDISTSSRYGISGRHEHYDALNALKRGSDTFLQRFSSRLAASIEQLEKDGDTRSFADLDKASAESLNLVALDEMDLKLAIDKIVRNIFEAHRIGLECLTIRAALVAKLEPRQAKTPFHPSYIVQAFADAFSDVSTNSVVVMDAMRFFNKSYIPVFDTFYPSLNGLFIDAGVEPALEEDIEKHGSLLNPVKKRIVKSEVRAAEAEPETLPEAEAGAAAAGIDQQGETQSGAADRAAAATPAAGAPSAPAASQSDGAPAQISRAGAAAGATRSAGPRNRHDAMYEAVLNALETGRMGAQGNAPGPLPQDVAASTDGAPVEAKNPASASANTAASAGPALSQEQLLGALLAMQGSQPASTSLGDLEPLETLVRGPDGTQATLDRDETNRLGFVDNVFRTLHENFEVSTDMAPSLAQLRVPLARLSLREPRFFTQPEHPAHKLLDTLSVLASADHTVNQSLKNKVQGIIERVVSNYDDDSAVFESAQEDLHKLLEQQDRIQSRNVERVISGLEGQEKLNRAQQRVDHLLDQHLDRQAAPESLLQLLDGGWRASLVQLALREGQDSVAWREEEALLETLLKDLNDAAAGRLDERELRELRLRLRALDKRLHTSNPGSVAHEAALRRVTAVLTGEAPLATAAYPAPAPAARAPDPERVEQLPRLRRWLNRVQELEVGAKLRYRDKDGRKRLMSLIWVSENRDRFAFVNERGQKIAELTAVQLARQLSRGARPPSAVDKMSVLDQSVYQTLERAQKTLSFDRNRDSLTQLINGDSLLFQLRRSLRHAQQRGSEHAFMLLNIDNFALVNEVFDETSGDQVLTEFARLLGQLNDRRALTARIEKDQFGILLTYSSTEDARQIGDKIRDDIARSSLDIAGERVSFTVSIGVAAIVQASESADQIMTQAQDALDMAKRRGRDQVVIFDVDQQQVLEYQRERDASRKRLDDAMSTDSLVLRAQPIVQSSLDNPNEATHRYEILLCLRDDNGELQSPQSFIMSAERFGYVTLVDRWVLRETFTWISRLMDAQKEVPELSINLSGTSITDNDFLDYVLEEISEHGVGTSRLCFEITETGAIDNLPKAADFVRTLKNLGVKFSLDDFGTGLASHKYLKELPVDYVKIDGTFITNVHKSRTDFAMAKSINDLAHFLGQKTVAECVEHEEVVPALREIGIDYLQGWGIGMPLELHEITDLLANLET